MAYPKEFIPDLRRLQAWPSLSDSLWRNPDLVELTYAAHARLVRSCVGSQPCRVLYVGPGLGHIALELARDGHDVLGVEIDQDSVDLATRAAETDPLLDVRGTLSYEVAEFPGGFMSDGSYDRVLFSRVLHHIPDTAAAVDRAAALLAPGGRLVCVDFAHDRLGDAGAQWMARTRLWLSNSGRWPESVAESVEEEASKTAREWRDDHEGEGLNSFQLMLDPLGARFDMEAPLWHPYLFWELAADMCAPADREGSLASFMRDDEAELISQQRLSGVLFSTKGPHRAGS
jgi:2-polyprenyl-3-methyl-5-hydroxy-6-metoxy-1,4-benzoquinol methylase